MAKRKQYMMYIFMELYLNKIITLSLKHEHINRSLLPKLISFLTLDIRVDAICILVCMYINFLVVFSF